MSFIGRTLAMAHREVIPFTPSTYDDAFPLQFWGDRAISPETAMTLSIAYACTRVVSEDIAKVPLQIYENLGGERKEVARDHEWYDALHSQSNEIQTAIEFREMMTAWALNRGRGIAEKTKRRVRMSGGQSVTRRELIPLHPSLIHRKMVDDGSIVFEYADPKTRKVRRLLPDELLIVRGFNNLGVIELARRSFESMLARQGFETNMWRKGPRHAGVIQRPKDAPKWNDANRSVFRAAIDDYEQGGEREGRPLLLEDGMTWINSSFSMVDTQFVESGLASAEEGCRWYRVPQHKVQILSRCMPADTLVFTEAGPKRIVDVQKGDRVWSADHGRIQLAKVVDAFPSGTREVLTIQTTNRTVRATANHRMLVRRKVLTPVTAGSGRGGANVDGQKMRVSWETTYVPAGDLQVGDTLVTLSRLPESALRSAPNGRELTVGFMELTGLLAGDGNVCRDKSNHNKPAWVTIARGESANYMPHYRSVAQVELVNAYGRAVHPVESVHQTSFRSTVAAAELTDLGFAGTSKTKRVPAWVYGLAPDLQLAYLRGFLDADGTVDAKGRITFYSVNRTLLDGIRHLCMALGIPVTNVRHDDQVSGPPFMVNTVETRVFRFTCSDPGANLDRIGSHDARYVDRLADGHPFGRKDRAYPRHGGGAEIEGASVARIVSIEVGEPEAVFDLQVEGTQNFIADGVIVHNSTNNNIEQQSRDYISDSLQSWAVRWDQSIQRDCLTDPFFSRHNLDAISQRGNTKERAEAQVTYVNGGIKTQDEIRIQEDMNPMGGEAATLRRAVDAQAPTPPAEPPTAARTARTADSDMIQRSALMSKVRAFSQDAASRVWNRERATLAKLAEKTDGKGKEWLDGVDAFYRDYPAFVARAMRCTPEAAEGYCHDRRAQVWAGGAASLDDGDTSPVAELIELAIQPSLVLQLVTGADA